MEVPAFLLPSSVIALARFIWPVSSDLNGVPAGSHWGSQQLRRQGRRGGERRGGGVRQVRDSQRGAQELLALPASGVLRQGVSAPLSRVRTRTFSRGGYTRLGIDLPQDPATVRVCM